MRIFRVRGEVVDLIAIGASSCLVQEFLRRRQRRAKPEPHGPVAPGGGRLLWRARGTNRKKPAKNKNRKIREIDRLPLCLQQFDMFWM